MIAPAKTGNDKSSSQAVTNIDHANKGTLNRLMPGARMLRKVVMILIEPKMELAPDT